MKLKELRELDMKKLQEQLIASRDKVRSLRFGLGNREVKNVREIRSLKKGIARVLTVLREKQHALKQVVTSIKK